MIAEAISFYIGVFVFALCLAGAVVLIVNFVVAVVRWIFRINEIVDSLRSAESNLNRILEHLEPGPAVSTEPVNGPELDESEYVRFSPEPPPALRECPYCGQENPADYQLCRSCKRDLKAHVTLI